MPGGRPSKPIALVQGHRTNKEKELRTKEESRLATGEKFFEYPDVAADKVAHEKFVELQKLFAMVEKDDALVGPALNRYCKLESENVKLTKLYNKTLDLDDRAKIHRMLMANRKMMDSFERENIMTVQAILRAVPKKPEPKSKNPMAKYFEKSG